MGNNGSGTFNREFLKMELPPFYEYSRYLPERMVNDPLAFEVTSAGKAIGEHTVVVMLARDSRVYLGVARCSPYDPFDEDRGLRIATSRAFRSLRKGESSN